MTFAERLKTKMTVDRWTRQVIDSLVPVDNYPHPDKTAMRSLLDMAGYQSRRIRDLEVYALDFDSPEPEILVLDNELKFFHTSLKDIALRKSPLLKEMIKPSNMLKILSDGAVVETRGTDSIRKIHRRILDELDLSFTPADIEEITGEGCRALQEQDLARVEEVLEMFSELLGLKRLPSPIPHISLWGRVMQPSNDPAPCGHDIYNQIILAGPVGLLNRYHILLDADPLKQPAAIYALMSGNPEPQEEGEAVLKALQQEILTSGISHAPT